MDFYFTDAERMELFNFIQLIGGKFIPDLYFYPTQQYYIISDGDDFLNHINQKKITHYFVIDNKFTFEPLIVAQNEYRKESAYSITQRTGGPYIDFSFYLGYAEDAKMLYKRSNIDIYSRFIHANSYEEFKATNDLKNYYDHIVKYIKSRCKITTVDGKKYRVGFEVLKEKNFK